MRAFPVLLALALAVALTFLTLPVVAIFVDSSPAELIDSLGEPGALDALWLSLRTTAAGARDHPGRRHAGRLPARHALVPRQGAGGHARRAAAGAAAGGGRDRAAGRGRAVRDPRRRGRRRGDRAALQTAGVVVALTFVASPFYVRQAMAAFAAVDRTLLDASRTLGASEARGFARVMIPGRAAGPRRRHGARAGPRAGRVRRHADVRRLLPGHHPDRPAGDLRPLRDRLRRRRSRCRRCSWPSRRRSCCR